MEAPTESAREEFARWLSGIREGSGRTYGSLARRTDISASTLHRYCTGQTVPVDFAPVAQVARLCGCTGERLVDLHRLWILADAERTLRQERHSQPAAQRAQSEAPASPGSVDPEEGREPEPPAPEPAPGAKAVHDKDPATAAPAPWKRRAAYAAALLPAALVLTLALTLDGTSTPPAARQHTGTGAPSSGSGHPTPPGRGAAHAPLASATPSASATGRPSGSGGAEHRPDAASPVPADPSPAGGDGTVPFSWSVNDHVWRYGCGHSYLIGGDATAVPPPPVEADAGAWASAVGGVHADGTRVRITLQGTGQRTVVLESMQVRVTARREPLRRNVHRMDDGCGGALTPRVFDVDLDRPRPVARALAGNDSGTPLPAVPFPYTVSATDPEVLLVDGRAADCDCDWYLELAWSAGASHGTVRVDDGGRPFRTSGSRGRPVFGYDTGTGRWVTAG
ncbi:helix-turn-helix domain-containing protein [Streptomyces griseus]|uniref:helix-turn-helix domain-containing protein n=1 Tax=Streptomyces griseus TaxID=1911 RepID=UPI00084032EF|nr:helix-turn-helix transcriptional regulator [Streptomyces griseus]